MKHDMMGDHDGWSLSMSQWVVIVNVMVGGHGGGRCECQVVLHYQSLTEQAHVRRLISQLHRNTGEVVKKRPRYVNNVCCRYKYHYTVNSFKTFNG